jgi:hypothetical protein
MRHAGFSVLRNGWPDFLLLNAKRTQGFAVELKRDKDKVSSQQRKMHKALALFGIPTHVVGENWRAQLPALKSNFLLNPDELEALEREVEHLGDEIAMLHARQAEILKLLLGARSASDYAQQALQLGKKYEVRREAHRRTAFRKPVPLINSQDACKEWAQAELDASVLREEVKKLILRKTGGRIRQRRAEEIRKSRNYKGLRTVKGMP